MSLNNSVDIELGGRTYHLKPSLGATRRLSRLKGGFQGVFEGIIAQDFDLYATVIKAGLESEKNLSDKDLENYVYEAGIVNLIDPVAKYVRCLQNGGKLEETESASSDSDEGNGHS